MALSTVSISEKDLVFPFKEITYFSLVTIFTIYPHFPLLPFAAINDQWRYYLVPNFLDATTPISYDTSTWKITYYYNAVNVVMRNVTVNIYPLG